jgi:DNA-binding CsgD family transcriptional regulator
MIPVTREDIVDRIYEASVLPDFWPEVLRDFAGAAESLEGVMVSVKGDELKWLTSSATADTLVQENYKHDGGMERTRRLLVRSHAGFLTDRDLFTEEEILKSPVYADYLIPNGFGRGTATVIHLPEMQNIIFHAEGDYKQGPYGTDTITRLDGLRPHLARSAMLSARLSFERARTSVETLAGLGFAACAVRQNGSVLVGNAQFERDKSFWTTRLSDRIALHDRNGDRQLADSLAMILSDTGVRSIPLRPRGHDMPGVLHIVPVRRAAHDLFNQAAAILVLTQANRAPTTHTPLLQALFDLTATEADLAARIGSGQTVEQIALIGAKGVETVRSQLKSVLAKTGCRRQADLARLLGQLVPAGM